MSINVDFFKTAGGRSPVVDWLRDLKETDPDGAAQCIAVIKMLREHGPDLGMPHSKPLRDGILELRARCRNRRYRILYFYFATKARNRDTRAVIAHSLIKKSGAVPKRDIDLTIKRRTDYWSDPAGHMY